MYVYIVIILMNNSILGGQRCTDYVDIQENGEKQLGRGRLAIIPRLNFTCSGRITSITARVGFINSRNEYPSFQVWRAESDGSTLYNRIGEVQLQSDDQATGNGFFQIVNITLTGNNATEFQSGDVVGYYHPPNVRYSVRDISTNGYFLYRFDGSPAPNSVDLSNRNGRGTSRQPLIRFTIGIEIISHSTACMYII